VEFVATGDVVVPAFLPGRMPSFLPCYLLEPCHHGGVVGAVHVKEDCDTGVGLDHVEQPCRRRAPHGRGKVKGCCLIGEVDEYGLVTEGNQLHERDKRKENRELPAVVKSTLARRSRLTSSLADADFRNDRWGGAHLFDLIAQIFQRLVQHAVLEW